MERMLMSCLDSFKQWESKNRVFWIRSENVKWLLKKLEGKKNSAQSIFRLFGNSLKICSKFCVLRNRFTKKIFLSNNPANLLCHRWSHSQRLFFHVTSFGEISLQKTFSSITWRNTRAEEYREQPFLSNTTLSTNRIIWSILIIFKA